MGEVATFTLDIGTLIAFGSLVGVFVAWEWRKVITIKTEIALLKAEMQALHQEHQILIAENSQEHIEVIRELTRAVDGMRGAIDLLQHYIQHLGELQGKPLPPPIRQPGDH